MARAALFVARDQPADRRMERTDGRARTRSVCRDRPLA